MTETERGCRRREFLAVVAGSALVGAAGCSEDAPGTDAPADTDTGDGGVGDDADGADAETETTDDTEDTDESGMSEDTTTETETESDLDLREANVVGVEVEKSGDAYGFDVTLYHDDDGEDGYANWWQVETLDGEQLGRRKLLHAHSTDPFTRSETIEVPDDLPCVVVRGHDQTHEYGGQAMTVDVESGDTATVRQGSEKQSLSESDCP